MNPRSAVGCDLVAITEIDASLSDFGDRFLARVFTAGEVEASVGASRSQSLAARFAAKEAVIKALQINGAPTPPTEIEVVGSGVAPRVVLHGSMARLAAERRWEHVHLSLSHTDCHAMAVVVVDLAG